MDHRRRRVQRGFRVCHGGEHLVVDADQRASVFCFSAALGDDGAHRLALPAGALNGDGMLRCRLDTLEMRQHADPRRDHFRKLGAGDDRNHAWRLLRLRRCDVLDPCMRVRRAHEGDMGHARQRDVADILAAALGQPRQIGPRHRAADIGIRPVERREAGRLIVGDFHFFSLPLVGEGKLRSHKNRVGHIRVRHICADGELSKPRPSSGCLKLRPMMSTKSLRSTLALGSNE